MQLGTQEDMLEVGPVPLYYQLEQRLRQRIIAREFAPGSCLPTEDKIGEHYGVSRITVRRALEALQSQGLINRRRGLGSFVNDTPQGIDSKLSGSLREFLTSASTLFTTCISFEETHPPRDVAECLMLQPDAVATRMRTVGSLEGEGPVAFLDIWFPIDVGRALDQSQIDGKVPIIQLAEQALHGRLVRAEQTIEPGYAGKEPAHYLDLDPKAPVLRVRRIYYVHPNRPIEVAYVCYHPERYRYAIDFHM